MYQSELVRKMIRFTDFKAQNLQINALTTTHVSSRGIPYLLSYFLLNTAMANDNKVFVNGSHSDDTFAEQNLAFIELPKQANKVLSDYRNIGKSNNRSGVKDR